MTSLLHTNHPDDVSDDTHDDWLYPSSDGNPVAENTIQYPWIVIIQENLEIMFVKISDVFIAADLFWYPVPVQVVFETLSERKRTPAGQESMARKFEFYQRYGVEEYYVYDPESLILQGWQRQGEQLVTIPQVGQWISPRLGIRFHWQSGQGLVLYRPDGQQFLSPIELERERKQQRQRAKQAELAFLQQQQQAEPERQRAEQKRQRAERSQQEAVPCLLNLGLSVERVASALNLSIDVV